MSARQPGLDVIEEMSQDGDRTSVNNTDMVDTTQELIGHQDASESRSSRALDS